MKNYYFIPAAIVLCFLAPFLSFRYLGNPFIWIFLSWGVMFAFGAACCVNSKIKLLLINIAVVFFTLSIFEAYLGKESAEKEPIQTTTLGFYKSDEALGYRPAANFRANARKMLGSEAIYDVTYTTDSNGLRISPPFKKGKNQPCILFFGGSVTFGEGVNDEEAMPYRVGVRTEERFQVYNFGFIGYGPHQMLSAVERGLVKKGAQCSPKHIIYQAIWSHLTRAAGRAIWDRHGPRYTVGKQGEAIYSGNFDSDKLLPGHVTLLFQKSLIYSKIFGEIIAVSRDDAILFHAVVRKTRDLLKIHYPQALFQVFYWDYKGWPAGNEEIHIKLVNGFRRDHIPVHLISDILPGFHDNQAMYNLSPYDGHPNALAHDMIAQYIAENILIARE